MIFNRYLVDLLEEIKDKGHVTRETQTVYKSSIGFFLAMKWLKEHNLIVCDGVDEKNYKIWALNLNGKKVVRFLGYIREILKEEEA
jgi:hypothetical protein